MTEKFWRNMLDENRRLRAILRNDFKSFCLKVFQETSPGTKYLDNWHIDVICDRIELLRSGGQNRLIINLPPRYMKSIICSIALPAYLLGHNPQERILCVSYADELALKLALDCRKVMESFWYQKVFPHTRISTAKRGVADFVTTSGGGRFSTSVGGALTGRGGNWLILDDPLKPADAMSDVLREKTNDWYGSTLYSRLDDKANGKILLIMQRVHPRDLTGFLLETDPSFSSLVLPIIAKEREKWRVKSFLGGERVFGRECGEPLHPARENLEQINRTKENVGAWIFATQYQQSPQEPNGGVIKKDWLKFFNIADLAESARTGRHKFCLAQSWDTATKIGEGNDYSVCITYLWDSAKKIYVLNVYRERLEFPALVRKAKELAAQSRQTYACFYPFIPDILVEDMNSGIGLAQELKGLWGSKIKPIHPVHDKQTRLKSVSHLFENGTCRFPDDNPPWWPIFERELLLFPNAKYDDQCDALSQLLAYEMTERADLSWLSYI